MIPETRNDDNIDLVSQQKVIEMKLWIDIFAQLIHLSLFSLFSNKKLPNYLFIPCFFIYLTRVSEEGQ